ncbi:ABC transporter substrate-binding protein [Virgibacillus necropolis]|uniref:Peptide ABC transporter substrate-binding protein n=1 Tax=Virgibacillus necropolis TaxID=163877 RepID=A0A221M999_9BACI|nr:ABC transporter substrate-binding protein [Virgibacillus necropolis]ASN04236.1 peptide ABC transporter substrate-binding protein [Virgibacillus necropolis]
MHSLALRKLFFIFILLSTAFIISACSSDSKSETGTTDDTASSEVPKDGGVLDVGLSSNPNTLDPIKYTGAYESQIIRQIGDTLLVYNKDLSGFKPSIATKWEVSEDMKSYTFTLRDDVYFQPGKYQDGRQMTAEDVKFSLERSAKKSALNRLSGVDSIEVTGEFKVTLHLNEPNAALLAMLTDAGNIIIPKEGVEGWGEQFGAHLIGTGPFQLKDWQTDQAVELVRHDKYWGEKPHLDGVTFKIISDPTMMANAIRSGDIDIATDIKGQNRAVIEKDKNLKLLSKSGLSLTYIDLNNIEGPTADPKVREAIYKATNVEKIVKGVNQWGGASVSYMPLPKESWGYSKDLEKLKPEYNPKEAKEILAETDYADGFKTELYVLEKRSPYAVIFQNQMKENLNIDVEIKVAEWGTLSEIAAKGKAPMYIGGWSWYPDPYFFLNQTFHSDQIGSLGNGRGYSNEKVDKLLDQANTKTVDQDERAKLYQEAIKIAMGDFSRIELDNLDITAAITKNVKGFEVSADGSINIVKPNGTNVWLNE